MIELILALGILIFIWTWFKKSFPTAAKTTTIIGRGAWAATKVVAKGAQRVVDAGAEGYAAAHDTLICPLCRNTFTTIGEYRCTTCGFRERRAYFAPCSHCAKSGPTHMRCPHCQLSVRAPGSWLRTRR